MNFPIKAFLVTDDQTLEVEVLCVSEDVEAKSDRIILKVAYTKDVKRNGPIQEASNRN